MLVSKSEMLALTTYSSILNSLFVSESVLLIQS